MLCNANLQAIFAMWSLKVSWSLKITPRFLTELHGVIVEEPNWMVKSCCRVAVAGKTRKAQSVRQAVWNPCSYRWIIWLKLKMVMVGRRSEKPRACVMGPRDVEYMEKRRGPRTDPWRTPVSSWYALETSSPQVTLKDLSGLPPTTIII